MTPPTPAPCRNLPRGYLGCPCSSRVFRLEPVIHGGTAVVPVCCDCEQPLTATPPTPSPTGSSQ